MRNFVWPVSFLLATLALPSTAAWADPQRSTSPSQSGQAATSNADAIKTFQFGAPWEKENRVTQGSRVGDTVYVAGQFSHELDGTFVGEGDVAKQTRQTFANLDRVLAGLGASKQGILDLEVFLVDPGKTSKPFIEEYKRYVGDSKLTVTVVGVSGLYYPKELVEIRAVAHATQPN